MSNEAVCSFVHSRLRVSENLESICNQVIDTCLHKVRTLFYYYRTVQMFNLLDNWDLYGFIIRNICMVFKHLNFNGFIFKSKPYKFLKNCTVLNLQITEIKIIFYFFQGSRDNMSIILIVFPGAPKPTPETIEKEEELERNIRKTIKGYYKKYFCRRVRTNI